MAVNYMGYIRVKELLAQQIPLSTEHDETLFIIIHQVYELWFKQLVHETRHLGVCLEKGDVTKSMRTMKRMLTIMKTLVGQVD
ncbi:MAG: tryptophan 2,3-dioxygenase, partial [Bdellovibrionales bacterium]|nr:tryptophan 2,3-dioxygenase [Bdellovibrionales bacterium]